MARKATAEEKREYAKTKPVYPLWGFCRVGKIRCAVEHPNEGPGEPNYEIMAPDGYIFEPDGVHTMLCQTLEEVCERAAYSELDRCTCEDCERHWKK